MEPTVSTESGSDQVLQKGMAQYSLFLSFRKSNICGFSIFFSLILRGFDWIRLNLN